MFNCPGKVCRHLPGYFFARSLGTGKFPVIVFMPRNSAIRKRKSPLIYNRSAGFCLYSRASLFAQDGGNDACCQFLIRQQHPKWVKSRHLTDFFLNECLIFGGNLFYRGLLGGVLHKKTARKAAWTHEKRAAKRPWTTFEAINAWCICTLVGMNSHKRMGQSKKTALPW